MNFTIGGDPEFIISDKNDNIVSAIDVVKGTRNKRIKINKNEYYYDNVLAECTILPSNNKEEFIFNVKNSIDTYKKLIYPYKITDLSSNYFSKKDLLHKDARKSGCSVEYCAYSLETISSKKINKILNSTNLRTAGGHIHLGTDLGKNHESCVMLVRMLDLFLGFASLLIDNNIQSVERRKIFGQAGRYRQPKYGIEYRTLSNFWLFNDKLVGVIYDICEFTIDFTKEKKYENFWKIDYEKLNSDDFWNNDGDPADCHFCYGYDCKKFKNLFINKDLDYKKNIMEIFEYYLDKKIKNKIFELANARIT